LLAGCPDASDDQRISRAQAGDPATAVEYVPDEYVCTNIRYWREDLDMPDYLKNPTPADQVDPRDNVEAGRERRKREYKESHEGTRVICHNKLDKDAAANRGTCSLCTGQLKEKGAQELRILPTREGPVYNPNDPIELRPEQQIADKIEFRLKWLKEDYLTKADEQIASYREWLTKRWANDSRTERSIIKDFDYSKPAPNPPEPIFEKDQEQIITLYVERAKAKGYFTKDESNPKSLPKFGLPPLAEPLVQCPNCKKPVNITQSRCWNCNFAYTMHPRDERSSISEPYEFVCPFCKQPVDPSINYCSNPSCQKFHRAADREGVCWRCGGSGVCPDCLGSGKGGGPIVGGDDCYMCGKTNPGVCSECNGTGFMTYDGGLPAGFKGDHRAKNDWKLGTATSGGGAGGEKKAGGGDGGEEKKDK
jgi:hypothetical protein